MAVAVRARPSISSRERPSLPSFENFVSFSRQIGEQQERKDSRFER